ncbi:MULTISPECIES: hypothetical protein [unclassified Enterococcus]|uniref:hypothetical protein n=1 Tax=unclassified Enterococcus TaxID=2608891 RepID=UPI001A9A9CCF|nr:hypothetical protein [Enterococcus sp. DIV1271a]MBO1300578.1 hypothetical protein [Enterococcus sp. DIV1271a]
MKKKLLSSLLVVGTSLGALAPATILATDVIGNSSADITINGSLGLDNTNPDEEIEEGDTNWINVTLDTATIFYNLSGTTTIASPTYNIENNSGRPVSVSIQNFSSISGDYSDITSLNFVSPAPLQSARSLITNGVLGTFTPATSGILFTLANNQGNLTANDDGSHPSSTTFSYSGSVDSTTIDKANPSFTLTLQLDAVNF